MSGGHQKPTPGPHTWQPPTKRLRIALLSQPFLPVPPPGYAGTERVVEAVARGLHDRGHQVALFAPGDSDVPYELVPTVPRSLWSAGERVDATSYIEGTVALAWEQAGRFDIIHSHLDTAGFALARHCGTPVLTTLHRRLDTGGAAAMIDAYPDVPLVAISESQRRWNPEANWIATIHHGLDFSQSKTSVTGGDYLLLVGRIAPEKGIAEAIEVARRSGLRLVLAAKMYDTREKEMFERVVQPAIDEGVVDWRGEVDTAARNELMAGALATLMLGGWPEPFGLVAIESMATGTPVIARRAGAYTETVQHGVTGYLVDDIDEGVFAVSRINKLDRRHIAAYARGRFSTVRMVWLYEQAYATVMAAHTVPDDNRHENPTDSAPANRLHVVDPIEELDEPA
ncbi:MAG: glycosyltransferase family 4 protein [Chloroflexota bacterium]